MSKKYLDTVGLNKLVANILSKFAAKNHSHSNVTTNSAGFMSSSDKVKLDGISAGANRTIVDSTLNDTSTNPIQNKAVKTALDGKASSSHTHPTAQITGLDSALAGKAPSSHNHSAHNITSGVLPIGRGGTGASSSKAAQYNIMKDVLEGTVNASDTDVFVMKHHTPTATNGALLTRSAAQVWAWIKRKCDGLYQPRGSYAASSHTHTISNVTNLQTELDKKQDKTQPVTTTGTGSAYTATVPHIKSLTAGMKFTMIPNVVSTAVSPTLNVNNLGAKPIRQRLSNSTLSTAPGATANWLAAGKPVEVMYDGAFWVVDFVRPNMASAYGTLPIDNGGVPKIKEYEDWFKVLKANQGSPQWKIPDGFRIVLFNNPDNTSARISVQAYPHNFNHSSIDYLIVTVRYFSPGLSGDVYNTFMIRVSNTTERHVSFALSGIASNKIATGVLLGSFVGSDFYPIRTIQEIAGVVTDLNLNYIAITRVEALVNDTYQYPVPSKNITTTV